MNLGATDIHTAATAPRLLFLRKFLLEGRRVASVAPSSRSLARAATRCIDRSRPQVIVDLGAGTGPVTELRSRPLPPGIPTHRHRARFMLRRFVLTKRRKR
jgi:hypothetical protein